MPVVRFSPKLYQDGPTRVVALDLSKDLGIKTGAVTSPALLANFMRIWAGERISTSPNATSQLYYVLHGRGFSAVNGRMVEWEKGDFLTLPAGSRSVFYANSDAALYWVHDEPLLRYLGAEVPGDEVPGRTDTPHPYPGRRPADLPAQPRYPLHQPPLTRGRRRGAWSPGRPAQHKQPTMNRSERAIATPGTRTSTTPCCL